VAQEEDDDNSAASAHLVIGGGGGGGGSPQAGRKRNHREVHADLDDLEEALVVKEEELKRTKTSVCAAARNLVCAISQELPIDPVSAEDGFLYEKREILEWMRKKRANLEVITSPITNEKMNTKLLPVVQVRNIIKELVDNGVIVGKLAAHWKKAMAAKGKVDETKKRAGGGDADSMYALGEWYFHGQHGLPEHDFESYRWFKKAADLDDTRAMAKAGWYLMTGLGAKKNVSHGMMLLTSAAERGSDLACYNLGWINLEGMHGLPKDKNKAMHWYKRATDGSCPIRQLENESLEKANRWLEKMDVNE